MIKYIFIINFIMLTNSYAYQNNSEFYSVEEIYEKSVHQSPGKEDSIELVNCPDQEYQNEKCIKFKLRSGERWKDRSGNLFSRCELHTKKYGRSDEIQEYSFDFYIPDSFPIEEKYVRNFIAQFWFKKNEGEIHKGPGLSIRFEKINERQALIAAIEYSKDQVRTEEDKKRILDNKKTILNISRDQLGLGKWHKMNIKAFWSPDEKGMVRIYLDKKEIANYKGPAGYIQDVKNEGPVMKFGLYTGDNLDRDYEIYFKNIKFPVYEKSQTK